MVKKQVIWFAIILFLVSGCTTTGKKASIDILSAPRDSRIVISSVLFYIYQNDKLVPMQPDQRFASIMVSTLEEYLQEKGYAAFFIGNSKGLLTRSEIAFIQETNLLEAIENSATQRKLFNPAYASTPSFENVPKILFPVFVCKKYAPLINVFGQPKHLAVTFYAFLVDSHTGDIIWSNSIKKTGSYNAIDLELRGLRWGHGCMWGLIKSLHEKYE